MTFQELILRLQNFWAEQGCILQQPWDVEKGAGTYNEATFLRALGPEPWNVAYVEPCRRPTDGRYGENPNRMGAYFQFQVLLKPSPDNVLDLYWDSLEAIGIDHMEHDLRLVEDDWEQPTLGAWGLGWEVWIDGMEATQFTYFQQVGGVELNPVPAEITYGLERICMFLQGVDSVYDLEWAEGVSYGQVRHREEVEFSHFNFEEADTELHFRWFDEFEGEAKRLTRQGTGPAGLRLHHEGQPHVQRARRSRRDQRDGATEVYRAHPRPRSRYRSDQLRRAAPRDGLSAAARRRARRSTWTTKNSKTILRIRRRVDQDATRAMTGGSAPTHETCHGIDF